MDCSNMLERGTWQPPMRGMPEASDDTFILIGGLVISLEWV